VRCSGKKIVYCYSPARWLYQRERYLPARGPSGAVLAAMRPFLVRWDHRAATGADGYLTSSRSVRDQIRAVYGIDAEVLPPPSGIEVGGAEEPIPGIEPGFFLCVARLLPYKNVAPVVEAMRSLPHQRLVVVGTGPEKASLQAIAPANAYFAGAVEDAQLRWLYSSCRGAVTASYEDYGLVPLEAAAFGRPTAALRFGGFLDTIDDGRTGLFFDNPDAADISDALRRLDDVDWDVSALRRHALGFSELAFISRLREVIENEAARN
jgi:glycosyltransferase involved in cell wall biosynthesis